MIRAEGYAPGWDIDLEYGHEGEVRVAELLGLSGKKIEVKHDRHVHSPNIFLETHQRTPSGYWRPSGVKTSTADYWVYVMGETFTVIPTGVLRLAIALYGGEENAVYIHHDIPTRGILIPRVLIQQVKRP